MKYHYAQNQWGKESDGGAFSPDIWQGREPSCAVHSQYHVLKDYGYEGTVEDLIAEAHENGWYDPESGTPMEHVGKLLEAHGVECDMYINATEANLVSELAQGKRIIVSVDSGELWGDEGPFGDILDKIGIGGGNDHALVVSGYDNSDPANPTIILTDSGTGQAAAPYPLKDFVDAWEDGHCSMIVPKDPPLGTGLAMAHEDSFLTDDLSGRQWIESESLDGLVAQIDAILGTHQGTHQGAILPEEFLGTHQGTHQVAVDEDILDGLLGTHQGTHQGAGDESFLDELLGTHQGTHQASFADIEISDLSADADAFAGDVLGTFQG